MTTSTETPAALQQREIPSTIKMAGGAVEPVRLKTGRTVPLFVRFLPARHLDRYLELRDEGLEAVLLEFVVQRNVAQEGAATPIWKSPDPKNAAEIEQHAALIDDLEDDDHARLLEVADWLNFIRAVSQAERKIASGQVMTPLRKRQAEAMLKPVELALRSLASSLATAQSGAAAETKP